MEYKCDNFYVKSDFNIKEIEKSEVDKDLVISIEDRCMNMYLDNCPQYIISRIQFPKVKSILIRYCNILDNNICTIHFLGDNGIHSTLANFEIDYSNHFIEIKDDEYSVSMKIIKKSL